MKMQRKDGARRPDRGLRVRAAALGMMLVMAVAAPAAQAQALDVAQRPLFLSNDVPPNIMFVIDDSGSMHWESMPDSLTKWLGSGSINDDYVMWMYPRTDGVHGASDYSNTRVPEFSGDISALFRSPHNNTVYYDPSITYRPWVDADGTPMPDADPQCAPDSRMFLDPTTECRDLTSDTTETADWVDLPGNEDTGTSRTFFPAVYYHYNGGAVDDEGSYDEVRIESGNAPFTGHGRGDRSDCTSGSCTYSEEIQNFANWYSYHRNRVFAARAGIGRAFAEQSENIRVGYGTINTSGTVQRGVRTFAGDDRDEFFDELYGRAIDTDGTPLRRALQGAGAYYERTDDEGPWSSTPGESGGDPDGHLECRQSYTVLMTDGFWSGNNPGVGNVDGSSGQTITGPDGQSFQYQPEPPYEDNHNNTLADVAMDYWNRDLRTDLDNRVPTSNANEAFWQHMVTYGIGLGVSGTLDPDNDLDDIESGSLDWPDPHNSDEAKLDDLWHASINSRGDFFSAMDPDSFAAELASILSSLIDRASGSAAAVAANSTRAEDASHIYQARFDADDWSGNIIALPRDSDGNVDPNTVDWEAADGIPGPSNRRIYVSGATQRVQNFTDLTQDQQDALDASPLGNGEDLFEYLLLGDDTNEGVFRERPETVLGDIVHSTPVVTHGNNLGYSVLAGVEGDEYPDHVDAKDNWPDMLYIGANDGMLHAFDARASGGNEVFAFAPDAVFDDLATLADPDYDHRFFVDGQLDVGDAYYNGSWEKILTGSTGAGAKAVFALNVSDPYNFTAGDALWEITGDDEPGLGHVLGDLHVARMNNDEWAVIFGNGYNSADGTAQLFVVPLEDPGNPIIIDTGVNAGSVDNGLGGVTPVDVNGDGSIDIVYGGDLEGNMWRFDVTSGNSNQWDGSVLFRAESPDGEPQPITAAPRVAPHSDGDVVANVLFGTGRFFVDGDGVVGTDPRVEAFYGIQDDGSGTTVQDHEIHEQQIEDQGTANGVGFRIVSDDAIPANARGWSLDLVYNTPEGERVTSSPQMVGDRVVFLTQIPGDDPCDLGGSGWLMELDAESGGGVQLGTFDDIQPGASGMGFAQLPMGLTPLTGGNVVTMFISLVDGSIDSRDFDRNLGDDVGRQSWRELR